jgi:hypothetical protein
MRRRDSCKRQEKNARVVPAYAGGLRLSVMLVEEEVISMRDQPHEGGTGGWSQTEVMRRKEKLGTLPLYPASRGGQRPR